MQLKNNLTSRNHYIIFPTICHAFVRFFLFSLIFLGACTPSFLANSKTDVFQRVSVEDANDLVRKLSRDPRVPYKVREYNCVYRAEMIIAGLLSMGVPPGQIVRITTLAPNLSKERLDRLAADISSGRIRSYESPKLFWSSDPLVSSAIPALEEYWPRGTQEENIVDYKGVRFRFTRDRKVFVGDAKFAFHPYSNVYWSVGHIAVALRVQENDISELRVVDPMLSDTGVLTIAEWKAAQNYPDGLVLTSSIANDKPSLLVEHMSKEQILRALEIAGRISKIEVMRVEDSSLASLRETFRTILVALHGQRREDFYNEFFSSTAYPYAGWSGFSIAGPMRDEQATPVEAYPGGLGIREKIATDALRPFVYWQEFLSTLSVRTEK